MKNYKFYLYDYFYILEVCKNLALELHLRKIDIGRLLQSFYKIFICKIKENKVRIFLNLLV